MTRVVPPPAAVPAPLDVVPPPPVFEGEEPSTFSKACPPMSSPEHEVTERRSNSRFTGVKREQPSRQSLPSMDQAISGLDLVAEGTTCSLRWS